jgi:molybdopterin converting factor small subunit
VQRLPKKFEVHLFGRVRDVIKSKKLEIEVEGVETLEELLHHLWGILPKEARSILFEEKGVLKPFYLIVLDRREVRLPRDLKLRLRDGASLKILPPIGAG